jgi:hypothetical protein
MQYRFQDYKKLLKKHGLMIEPSGRIVSRPAGRGGGR